MVRIHPELCQLCSGMRFLGAVGTGVAATHLSCSRRRAALPCAEREMKATPRAGATSQRSTKGPQRRPRAAKRAVSRPIAGEDCRYEVPPTDCLDRRCLGRRLRTAFTLPGAANFLLGMAALAAGLERALRFKSNRCVQVRRWP